MGKGTIYSICISSDKEEIKKEIEEAIVTQQGLENDGFPGEWGRVWGRQISCLNFNSMLSVKNESDIDIEPGEFGENILIQGLDLSNLDIGDWLKFGASVILEVTQIGKEDHLCSIHKDYGINLLSFEGVFCKVIKAGKIKKGDIVELVY